MMQPGSADALTRVRDLLKSRNSGYALPQGLYTSNDAFAFDLQAIFYRHWLQAGLDSEIPNPGDYLTKTVGRTSIILLRGRDGAVRGFFNTCRHRGAQICQEPNGRVRRLVCPYHQWTYDDRGALLQANGTAEDFDREQFGLKPIHVALLAGVIYVCLSDNPPDFGPICETIGPLLEPHELWNGKVVHTVTLVEAANWKLVMENARECLHCRARHPELMRTFREEISMAQGGSEPWLEAFRSDCSARNLDADEVEGEWYLAGRYPLAEGTRSLTLDGALAVSKPLGRLGDANVGTMRWALQPNCFNHVTTDYAFLFEALPTGPLETVVTAKWIVHKDAVEGRDYDLSRLIGLWDVTNRQDLWLSENNQRGVNSLGYMPGPYSEAAESHVRKFVDWYAAAAEAFLQQSGVPQ